MIKILKPIAASILTGGWMVFVIWTTWTRTISEIMASFPKLTLLGTALAILTLWITKAALQSTDEDEAVFKWRFTVRDRRVRFFIGPNFIYASIGFLVFAVVVLLSELF